MSSRPLPPAWLLFMTLQLGVSRPAFPIPTGFPSPNCMSRPHPKEGSHRPQEGCLLLHAWEALLGLRILRITQLWIDSFLEWRGDHELGRASSCGCADLFIIYLAQALPLHMRFVPSRSWKPKTFITQIICSVVLQVIKTLFEEENGSPCSPICLWYLGIYFFFFFNPAYCGMLFFPVSVPNSDLFSKSQFNVLELCLGKLCSFIFLLTYRRATLFSYTVVHRYKTWARDYLGHGKSWWCFFLHMYCWQMALSVLKYILYFS